MKRLFLYPVLALAFACGNSNSAQTSNTLSVDVHFNGLTDQSVELVLSTDSGFTTLDSAFITEGMVHLESEGMEVPNSVFVKFESVRRPIFLFLNHGEVKVEVTGTASSYTYSVSGGTNEAAFNDYLLAKQRYSKNMEPLQSEYSKAASIDDTMTMKLISDKADEYMSENRRSMIDIAKRAGAFGAQIALSELYDADDMLLDSIYTNIPVIYSKSTPVVSLKERIEILKKVKIGEVYTDFSQLDTTGTMISLSSVRGKYTLVDFWASWCGPCRAENPNVVEAFNKYSAKGFTVVGVSLDQSKENWIQAIQEDQLTWAHMSDLKYWQNEAAALYGVRAIPQNVMIDENGIIVAKNLREEALHEWLEKHL